MEKDKTLKIINTVFVVIFMLGFTFYFFELINLHYNQTLYPETGRYESDLYAHLQMATDNWGYSILAVVFKLLSFLPTFGFHFAVALLLAACEAGTLAVSFILFRKNDIEIKSALFFTAASGFVMPMFVRAIQPYRYIGYQSGSIWHNSTYIVMKLFALLCMILYLLISRYYKDRLDMGQVVVFSLLLAFTTSVKTNFILVLGPVALIFLLVDWIRGVPLKRILICAATVLPSVLVIVFQEIVLFGKSTGNGIIIDPLYSVYLRAEKPYITMILSAAFPVTVLFFNFIPVLKDTISDFREQKSILRHRMFLVSWAMWLAGFLELILLREVGERELDDNFAWGYDFCLFFLFVTSIIYFANNIRAVIIKFRENNKVRDTRNVSKRKNTSGEKKTKTADSGRNDEEEVSVLSDNMQIDDRASLPIAIVYLSIILAIFLYHTYCGVYYFVKLSQGVTFFMR